jgi:5-formyltetrahydrofolate cyclo-ligase
MTDGDDLPRRKAQLRREVAARLKALSPEDFAERGRRAAERLKGTREFEEARSYLLYASMPDEIDTAALIDRALACGREVYLPVCAPSGSEMSAVRVEDRVRDLAPGRFGILEPRAGLPAAAPGDVDFVLVPGRAFDRHCRRLGRGRGFYDRFLQVVLEEGDCGCAGALALDLQVVAEIPVGEHDLPVHVVATESRLIRPPAPRALTTPPAE